MTKHDRDFERTEPAIDPDSQVFTRRAFLGNVAAGLGGLLCPKFALGEAGDAAMDAEARVVIVRDSAVINGGKVNAQVAGEMVHRAVCMLTGKTDREQAWKVLFSAKERVAIKMNTRHPPVGGNREVADAIVDGLKSAGVDENRIIIFDFLDHELTRQGFKLNDSSKGVRCYGIRECSELKAGPVTVQLSKILIEQADALINVPAFRHHGLAGITISMKNHLGTVRNPRSLHRDNCLHVADLNALDPIRKKTRLIIADAILGQYNGGPSYRPQFAWKYGGLIAGTDTVAVDTVGTQEILAQRHKRGIEGPIRPTPGHISRAAELGLGVGDLSKIEIVRLAL